jgi:hypothetical protein
MKEKSPKIAPKMTKKDKIQNWRGKRVVHEFDPWISLRC